MAEATLDKLKRDIALSKEWKELHQAVTDELDRSLKAEHKLPLTIKEKSMLFKKVAETVRESEEGSYQQLEEKVPKLLQQHFFSNSKIKKSKPKTELIDQTSALLIQQYPQFRAHLKSLINMPLPMHLRKAAWNAFLKNTRVKKDFLDAHNGKKLDNLVKDNLEFVSKCKKYFQSSALIELKGNNNAIHTMCVVIKFWEKRADRKATDSEMLLCVPFIYCCRSEIASVTHEQQTDWRVISEAAEMYCAFMEMMPLNMKDVLHDPKNADAVIVLCKEVESLMSAAEPKLTAQLNKIMQISESKRGNDKDKLSFVFHKQLLQLVHPFLQRMFVGVCSLETLSFILDQCFIFLELPTFKFMPYCITTWIILNKRKLMNCHNVESAFDTLSKHSLNLTVENFQKEISNRFLSNIKQGIRIEIDLEDDDDSLSQVEGQSLLASRIERGPKDQKVEQTLDQPLVEDITTDDEGEGTLENKTPKPKAIQQSNESQLELEELKEQVALLMRNDKRARNSEEMLKMERETHLTEMEKLKGELTSLKDKLKERSDKMDATPPRLPSTLPDLPEKRDAIRQKVTPTALSPSLSVGLQSLRSSESSCTAVKKFNPNSLSPSDIKEINLLVLNKFNEAMYLICHGSQEEKEELSKIVKHAKKHENTNRSETEHY